jgi:hypothetical protein
VIERSTPLLFGLYGLVTLFGQAFHPDGQIPVAQAAWYRTKSRTHHSHESASIG